MNLCKIHRMLYKLICPECEKEVSDIPNEVYGNMALHDEKERG